jgi:hypothetical protein
MPEKRQRDHPLNAVIEAGGGDTSEVVAMVKYRALPEKLDRSVPVCISRTKAKDFVKAEISHPR